MSKYNKPELHIVENEDGTISHGRECTSCREIKPLENFKTKSDGWYGRTSQCKSCSAKNYKTAPETNRAYKFIVNYGITINQYNEMYQKQNGKCVICQEKFDVLHVDHCHKTEQVRGLLCLNCNVAIGALHDDPVLLERARDYLLNYQHVIKEGK